ncbi:EAL domain-containing protein, partial [Escherichia coli]
MYRAKNSGKNQFATFNEELHRQLLQRHALERELRAAIERQEFVVCHQPKVSLPTGAVVGMEALIRWEHPVRGRIPPQEFV